MKLNAPKQMTWLIAVIIGVLGILLSFGIFNDVPVIKELARYSFWLVTAGFGLLTLGTFLKGL